MRTKTSKVYVGDFETTVYEGQTDTQVWASALVELGTEDVQIFHSIDETFEALKNLNSNVIVYYHNLKFDGSFWMSYLLTDLKLKQAYTHEEGTITYEWKKNKDMSNNSFKYTISNMGQWYTFTIKVNNHFIELRDSLKLLPFSVKRIGNAFATKHKKLDMTYSGFRYAGCTITDDEKKYIANDVLVVKEALEIMFEQGHNKLTIGSCCLAEFKSGYCKEDYSRLFPALENIEIDEEKYGTSNADAYIRKSYHGGWCYLAKGKENKIYRNGTTADVNSLYPSMMSSESGNYYPIGEPHFWKGDIPEEAKIVNNLGQPRYYFVRVKCRFYLKAGMLPFIQIKGSALYRSNECLETSSVYNKHNKKYYRYYQVDGATYDTKVIMTFTMTDWELFQEHYDIKDLEILDGCWFYAEKGLFDSYMSKYIKQESKGAMRELAKLFLNNLYGKMASNIDSSFKVAYEKEDGSVGFIQVEEKNKKAGYIAVGSAITSYARNFTIRTAQKNYYGANKAGFIYADTDSIHCDLKPEELKGVPVHDTEFCHWKLESCWDKGIFARQKTYIEHITHENLVPVQKPYYNVKCAGMPERCKELLIKSIEGYTENPDDGYNEEEKEFLRIKRTLNDFKIGLIVPSKLLPKRIRGGVLLVPTTYEMR
jgi:hypothetical protein